MLRLSQPDHADGQLDRGDDDEHVHDDPRVASERVPRRAPDRAEDAGDPAGQLLSPLRRGRRGVHGGVHGDVHVRKHPGTDGDLSHSEMRLV